MLIAAIAISLTACSDCVPFWRADEIIQKAGKLEVEGNPQAARHALNGPE